MEDREKIQLALISFLAGAILALLLYPKPEAETFYRTTVKEQRDTVRIEIRDTVRITKTRIKVEKLRDTVLVNFQPKISQFKTSSPFEYGNTYVSGEVLGEVLKMDITNDFKIPVVTNTITETKTETIVKKPKGVYLGAGVNSLLHIGARVSYLDNKYLFQYEYQPVTKIHGLSVSKKLF